MKKKAILLILLLLVSGCTIVRIDTKNIDTIIDVVLSKNNTLYIIKLEKDISIIFQEVFHI